MRDERRRSDRIRKKLRVRYGTDGLDLAGRASDVSLGGIFLTGRQTFPVGTRLHLHIQDRDHDLYAEGVVVRAKTVDTRLSSVEQSGMGVRLLGPAEALGAIVQARAGAKQAAPRQPIVVPPPAPSPNEVICESPEALRALIGEQLSAGVLWVPVGAKQPDVMSETEFWIHVRCGGPEQTIHGTGRVLQVFTTREGTRAVVKVNDPGAIRRALGDL